MVLLTHITEDLFQSYTNDFWNCLKHNSLNNNIKKIIVFSDIKIQNTLGIEKVTFLFRQNLDQKFLYDYQTSPVIIKSDPFVRFYQDLKNISESELKEFVLVGDGFEIFSNITKKMIIEGRHKIKNSKLYTQRKKVISLKKSDSKKIEILTQESTISSEKVNPKLDVIIISVNYNDYLIITLPKNLEVFENITVITTPEDEMCQKICKKFGVRYITTNVMYELGAKFNKGKTLDFAIKMLNDPGYVLLLDADMIINRKIDTSLLKRDVLYTTDRVIIEDLDKYKVYLDNTKHFLKNQTVNVDERGIGFFQLFHMLSSCINRELIYPTDSDDSSWTDLKFRDKFSKRENLELEAIHLGPAYTNWSGRNSEKFLPESDLLELLNKKSTYTICSFYFNYNNDWRQKRNFIKFLEQWKDYYGNVIVGILDYGDIDFEIPCEKIIIEGDVNKRIWSKEILINKIVEKIDTDYILWVDGDLIYNNLDWLNNIDDVTKGNDFIQLFETINYIDEGGNITNVFKSIASSNKTNVDYLLSKGFRPGGAWMGRTSILKEKNLFEKMYVGGGDTIFTYGLYKNQGGRTLKEVQKYNSEIYKEANQWINDFGDYKVGYLNETVNHLYHGDLKDRNYNERYKLLKNVKNRGIMLIAFGFDYEKAAIYCLKSIRKYSNIPVVIHTNIPEFVRSKELNKFEQVYFETHDMNDDENRIIKTQLSKYTIFDETLYIDADSSVISEKFLYPFEYLNEYDIVSPEWKTYTKKDIYDLSINSNKFKKFLKITEKFDFDKKTYIAGGICYFNRNDNSHRFFNDFHRFWKETGKKEDMPGLNGAMFNNELIVKIINNKEFNNYNSEIIVSHHNSLIDYEHLKDFTRKRYNPISDQWEFCDQGSTELYKKPKIAFVYDIKGWAFYIMAHNVKYHLSKKFEIDIIKFDNKIDEDNYDAIVCFSPGVLPIEIKNFEKLICGISSHKSGKNIEKLKRFKSVFANEIRLYESIQNQDKYYIENGVDTEFFKIKRESSEKFRIGSLGSEKWSEHKGKFRIEEICKRLGDDFENKSIFVDTISKIMTQKEVREYYSNIDVLVISSVSETGPNTLLEAMSCGIPVISNRVGLAPIIIDNLSDGILIDDLNNLNDYVKSIKMLKSDTVLYENISNNSKVKIKKWDWSEKSKDFEKMISKFIKL